jgi:hypothetical protein
VIGEALPSAPFEEHWLVKRMIYPIEKRGQMLFITDLDKNQCKASWPHYARVNQHLCDKRTEAETEKLAAPLGKLIEQG